MVLRKASELSADQRCAVLAARIAQAQATIDDALRQRRDSRAVAILTDALLDTRSALDGPTSAPAPDAAG